ncbi:MAG: glycosyltransferase family 4 protein [Nitrosotalea sp.]
MNVLLLTQFFSTTRGGGEYIFSLIADQLAKNGHKVWIITNKITGEDYPTHANIKIIFVKPNLEYQGGLPPGIIDNLRYSINTMLTGRKIIKNEKIDMMHSNNFAPALAGSVLSSITGRPHITAIHDIFSLCGKNYWNMWGNQANVSKINVILAPFFERLMIKLRYDGIHTVSEATKDDLEKFGAKKPIYVIPNSISTQPKDSNVNSNPFQFIHVGRLVFYKNIETIIKAIGIVKKKEPKIRLAIVGGGPHRKSLEEFTEKLGLEENIEFKGYVTTDEKIKLIAASNALVFPSLCEGFGLVILEAFDQSRPVLVSNIRPMSDIVTHEDNGFILNPHDENQWAEYLLRIIKNPQEASTMGKNGNNLLIKSYNQEIMYDKIMNMYSTIRKTNVK